MTFNENDYVIIPANVQAVYCVTSINVANTPRRVIIAPEGVDDTELYAPKEEMVPEYAMVNAENLTGVINLKPGFNCAINQTTSLTINAREGAGASLVEVQKEEIPVTEEEKSLLETGRYLSRGLKCTELVGSINDVKGPAIALIAGSGIQLDTESEPHTIIIKKVAESSLASCEIPGCN